MSIAGLGHFATAAPAALPARESLRSASAESLLGLASPSPPSVLAQPESDRPATVDAAGRPVPTPAQEQLIQQQIGELSSRDREVRAHEQAHSSVGGSYAGGPTYSFKRGPDGRAYAVGGEVSIDVSAIANDPAATLRKMEQVQRAALAPAEPSGQDRQVAAQAQVLAAQARIELAAQRDAAASAIAERKAQAQAAQDEQDESEQQTEQPTKTDRQDADLAPSLQLYHRLGQSQESAPVVDVVA